MRLLVSWMVSRIAFMPSIVRRTASPPLCATSTEWRATSAARSALPDTSSIEAAIALDRLGRRADLLGLGAARARQVRGQRLGLAWRRRRAGSTRLLIVVDQLAQRLDRVVDRIGDRAGDVLGHGRLHRQVALREVRHLVEQAHDGLLVAIGLVPLRVGRALRLVRGGGGAAQERKQQRQREQRRERRDRGDPRRPAERRQQHGAECGQHHERRRPDGQGLWAARGARTVTAHALASMNAGSSSSARRPEHRPVLAGAPERAGDVALAAHDRRRHVGREFGIGEAAESEDLVDQQPGWNLAMVGDHDARIARGGRRAAAEKGAQVDDRQQLAAQVREPEDPAPGPGYARER